LLSRSSLAAIRTQLSGTGCRLVKDSLGGAPDRVSQVTVSNTDCRGAMSISGKSRNIQPSGTAL
jgi:hypothetical protein